MPHLVLIPFLFALGACIGSFLNVVVWRLPRGKSIVSPPSHCPNCKTPLRWYDNVPVIGWVYLGGKCRYCATPISPRYPIVEAICGLLFAFYYVMFFMGQVGPCPPFQPPPPGALLLPARELAFAQDWPIYLLYMGLIAGLLAASLVDLELFMIPIEIPWFLAIVGIITHAIIDSPKLPGALLVTGPLAAMAAGGGVGLLISMGLWYVGKMPLSFPEGEPLSDEPAEDEPAPPTAEDRLRQLRRGLMIALPIIAFAAAGLLVSERPAIAGGWTIAMLVAVGIWMLGKFPSVSPQELAELMGMPPAGAEIKKWTRGMLTKEMGKEILFLLPPMVLASVACVVVMKVPAAGRSWAQMTSNHWVGGLLGAVLGALVGGFVVWIVRILGTFAFGRLAMGLGDVHLMFGVGAIVGAVGATIAFFLAPFFGISIALYMLFTGTRRELPYGPYLSLGTAFVLLFSCPITNYLRPGMMGLVLMVQQVFGGGVEAGM